MTYTRSLMMLLLASGLLLSASACGKRGDPVRPSEAIEQNASS